jgi:hypothetical protein
MHESHANVVERNDAHPQTEALYIKMSQKLVPYSCFLLLTLFVKH